MSCRIVGPRSVTAQAAATDAPIALQRGNRSGADMPLSGVGLNLALLLAGSSRMRLQADRRAKGDAEMTEYFQENQWPVRSAWLRGILGLAVAIASWGVMLPAAAAPVCGPGGHWVDACPAGTDVLQHTEGLHTIQIFNVGTFTLTMNGPTTVWRGAGATSPDHHIDTEIVSLQLVGGGMTLRAGDGVGNGACDGPLCSLGRITEQNGDSEQADSFFDIFFEIDNTPLGTLHNNVACRMEAVLDQVPPRALTTYICLPPTNADIALFTDNGTRVGRLLGASHTILPEPATLALIGTALIGMFVVGGRSRRRATR